MKFETLKNHIFLCYGLIGVIIVSLFNFYGIEYGLPYDSQWLPFLAGLFFNAPFWAVQEFLATISGTGLGNPFDLSEEIIFFLGLLLCIILDLIQTKIRGFLKNIGDGEIKGKW